MEQTDTKQLFTDTDHEIKYQINRLLENLGCDYGILSTVGSWKDTLSDQEILDGLKWFNQSLTR